MWNWLNRELLRLLSIPTPTGQEIPLLLHLESKADLLGVSSTRQYIHFDILLCFN